MFHKCRFVAVMLIALLAVPGGVFAREVPAGMPPAGFLRRAIAREAAIAAQTPAPQDAWDVVQGLPVGSRLTLTLTTGQDVTGTMVGVRPDAVVMNRVDLYGKDLVLPGSAMRPDGAITFDRSNITGVRVDKRASDQPQKHGNAARATLIGALIGAGAGAVTMMASPECSGGSEYCGPWMLIGVGVGAGAGAGVGAILGLR